MKGQELNELWFDKKLNYRIDQLEDVVDRLIQRIKKLERENESLQIVVKNLTIRASESQKKRPIERSDVPVESSLEQREQTKFIFTISAIGLATILVCGLGLFCCTNLCGQRAESPVRRFILESKSYIEQLSAMTVHYYKTGSLQLPPRPADPSTWRNKFAAFALISLSFSALSYLVKNFLMSHDLYTLLTFSD